MFGFVHENIVILADEEHVWGYMVPVRRNYVYYGLQPIELLDIYDHGIDILCSLGHKM